MQFLKRMLRRIEMRQFYLVGVGSFLIICSLNSCINITFMLCKTNWLDPIEESNHFAPVILFFMKQVIFLFLIASLFDPIRQIKAHIMTKQQSISSSHCVLQLKETVSCCHTLTHVTATSTQSTVM
ncbi:hypothetical protein EB796_004715 [Bugula neritina]|uniref:Uncharacterized protein n=1 Tax=Bugula neritina TaxID=10212 RepID=A0A7J7KEA2_BUGNE|nr:hypothetical protein EB796_004715 [Bugula neritina]